MSGQLRAIGASVLRKEGIPKVTGRALYADDLRFENCLYGRTVRSPAPHGIIRRIRFDPCVPWHEFTVVLPEDVPGANAVTLIDAEQPFLVSYEIQHAAEPVALIAHYDKEAVDDALDHIEVDIEELPATFSMEDALERGAVFKSYLIENGNPSAKWLDADVIVEETYRTGAQEHLYIEPQSVIAVANPGEGVTVWGSIQCPYYVQKALAPLFDLSSDRVRIIQTETGGGFGGKEEYPNIIAGHAALLSWKAGGRPVKMIYGRREDMWATTKRHPSKTRIKAGFQRDGALVALDIHLVLDGGAYSTLSSVVLSRASLHACGPYRCPDARVESHVVKTNSVPYGAFRGFGAPQAIFAIELHMSRAAEELGMDPAEIRRRNFLRKGDCLPTGQILKDEPRLESLMDRALLLSGYREKRAQFDSANRRPGEKRKGVGLSVFFHGCGFTGNGEVRLASQLSMRLSDHGGVEVLSANVEYGQGTNTMFAQIASEICGISEDLVCIQQPDTAAVPDSGPTVASRTTMIVGRLVERAAMEIRRRLGEPADFQSAARQYLKENGGLTVTVRYEPPSDVRWDDDAYRGDAYSAYSWSCDVAEVEIDPIDYAVRVTNFVSTVECGRVLNPAMAASQIEGGVVQGIGFALYENVVVEKGAMKNNRLADYMIPASADMPDICVEFVEPNSTKSGPFGAKGIGEMPIDGPAPAIAAAAAHALEGRFINELPLTPESIMLHSGWL